MTRNKINISILITIIFLGILLFFLNLFVGSVTIPFADLFKVFFGEETNSTISTIVFEYRLPQAVTALFAGAALSVAGLYQLNKLIILYDKNDVTLDGNLKQSSTDDMKAKFKSMNFNVIECDGHNIEKIDKAIIKAKQSKTKPTVIILKTKIAKDTTLEGSNKSHGTVFDDAEINRLKKQYGIEKHYLEKVLG